jgi:hypothetical protein
MKTFLCDLNNEEIYLHMDIIQWNRIYYASIGMTGTKEFQVMFADQQPGNT